jgi:hypothetical protein
MESYRFIGENWIEWFPAVLILAAFLVGVREVALMVAPPAFAALVAQLVISLVLYFAMIVRGLLFQELSTSNRRARAFRRAAG